METIVYEYKAEHLPGRLEDQEAILNGLGADGWKLISVTAAYDAEDNATYYRAFFVREGKCISVSPLGKSCHLPRGHKEDHSGEGGMWH